MKASKKLATKVYYRVGSTDRELLRTERATMLFHHDCGELRTMYALGQSLLTCDVIFKLSEGNGEQIKN
jgi:hypothetical protein